MTVFTQPDLLRSPVSERVSHSNRSVVECEDNLDFMAKLGDGEMKLVVTSPPYNIGKDYESKTSLNNYLASQERVIRECVRVLHDQGSICWQVGNYVDNGEIIPLDTVLYTLFRDHGLKLRNRIVWHFGHGLHCTKRLSGRYETINWWTKSDDYTWNLDPIRVPSKYPGKRHFKGPNIGKLSGNPKGKNPSDVWEFPNVKSNHPEKTIHPCQFPVELVERLVLSMTNEGDKVLDPYMGVGSTIIAALMHQRAAYGCDIIPEYVDIALQRVAQLHNGTLRTPQWASRSTTPRSRMGALMQIKACYTHLNGEEYLLVHRKQLWEEVQTVISEVDADACRTKISREKATLGKKLFSPTDMNRAFREGLRRLGWVERRQTFWVTSDEKVLQQTYALSEKEQRRIITESGLEPIMSYNQTDFVKDRVAIEIQFGKYAFVAHDLFVKHLSFYVSDVIDVGIEILPMKELEREMSSGVPYYERDLSNVLRQGRGVPSVPLVLIGVAP